MIKKVSAVTVLKGINFEEALSEIPSFAALESMLRVNLEGGNDFFQEATTRLLFVEASKQYLAEMKTHAPKEQDQIKNLVGAAYNLFIHLPDPEGTLRIEFRGLLEQRRCFPDQIATMRNFYFKMWQLTTSQTIGLSEQTKDLNAIKLEMQVSLVSYLQHFSLKIMSELDRGLFKEVSDPQSTHTQNAIQKALDNLFRISGGQAAADPFLETDTTLITIVRHLAEPGLTIDALIAGLELNSGSLFEICKHIFKAEPLTDEQGMGQSTSPIHYTMDNPENSIVLTTHGKLELIHALLGPERMHLKSTELTPLEGLLLSVIRNPDTRISQADYEQVFGINLSDSKSIHSANPNMAQVFGRMTSRASMVLAAHLDGPGSDPFEENILPSLSDRSQQDYFMYKTAIDSAAVLEKIKTWDSQKIQNLVWCLGKETDDRFRPVIQACMAQLNTPTAGAIAEEQSPLIQILRHQIQVNPQRVGWLLKNYGTELIATLNRDQVIELMNTPYPPRATLALVFAYSNSRIFVELAARSDIEADTVISLMTKSIRGQTPAHVIADSPSGKIFVELADPTKLGPDRVIKLMELRNANSIMVADMLAMQSDSSVFADLADSTKLGPDRMLTLLALESAAAEAEDTTIAGLLALNNSPSFVKLAEKDKLGPDRMMELIKLWNQTGNSMLIHTIAEFDSSIFVELADPDKLGPERIMELMSIPNKMGDSVACIIAQFEGNVFADLADSSKLGPLAVMTLMKSQTHNGKTIAYYLACSIQGETFVELADSTKLGPLAVMELMNLRNISGTPVAHTLAGSRFKFSRSCNRHVFVQLAAADKLGAEWVYDLMLLTNKKGDTLAHILAKHLTKTGSVFSKLAAEDKLGADRIMRLMMLINKQGETVAHVTARVNGTVLTKLADPTKLGTSRVRQLMDLRNNTGIMVKQLMPVHISHSDKARDPQGVCFRRYPSSP